MSGTHQRKKHQAKSSKVRDDNPDLTAAQDEKMSEVVDQHQPKPPKKKRKVDPTDAIADPSPAPEAMAVDVEDDTELQTPLPFFPAPRQPNAPSPSTLYRQGLDKALLGAEIVDASATAALNSTEDDGKPDSFGLSTRMHKRLLELGITELFAVQIAVLPFLLPPALDQRAVYTPYNPPQDVCVSAPTGSGKTLAYVVPIVEILSTRIVTRLRALVVLPTRDLVSQVRETFEAVSKGRGLKIGVATGQHSFAHEQAQLAGANDVILLGGSSKVDILICTPGRLIDHIRETPNFTLQHLRFLVIDEADRLVTQSFQDWLPQVLAAMKPARLAASSSPPASYPVHDAVSPHWSSIIPNPRSSIRTYLDEIEESSCQKLLFSATLTHDPSRIAALNLRDPKYFVVSGKTDNDSTRFSEDFTMPSTLSERMVVTSAVQKPLVLFHLLHSPTYAVTNALVFTKSAESTSRLVRLLQFLEDSRQKGLPGTDTNSISVVVKAYSSDLNQNERKSLLGKFRGGEVHVLICSDLISRGIDISQVSHVVSYDVPVDMRKYVHRVGRTARAGRKGDAWTLVEEQEAHHFKQMLSEANHKHKVKRIRIHDSELESLQIPYQAALAHLREAYST